MKPKIKAIDLNGNQHSIFSHHIFSNDFIAGEQAMLKKVKKKVESIDASGGGSGRRIKSQLIDWLEEEIKKIKEE